MNKLLIGCVLSESRDDVVVECAVAADNAWNGGNWGNIVRGGSHSGQFIIWRKDC
jgi:hypothetical protein